MKIRSKGVAVSHASLVTCTCSALSKGHLAACRRRAGVCSVLADQAVKSKLSKAAHVFFSREGHMKVAVIFDCETVMLPIGTASCLMWKAFRGSGNRVKRLFELVEQSGDLPVVSWSFHLWIGVNWLLRRQQQYSTCCDDSSCLSGGGCHWSSYSSTDLPVVLARNLTTAAVASSRWSVDLTRDIAEVTFPFWN